MMQILFLNNFLKISVDLVGDSVEVLVVVLEDLMTMTDSLEEIMEILIIIEMVIKDNNNKITTLLEHLVVEVDSAEDLEVDSMMIFLVLLEEVVDLEVVLL
jgi:hypothetical protein